VKDDLSCRELRGAPLLGHGGQETTQQSGQAPCAVVQGAAGSQSCLSAVVTLYRAGTFPCAHSCILSSTTSMGCNMNDPMVAEFLFVELLESHNEFARVNSNN